MGNPSFYYYPDAGGTLEVVDLGTLRLSDLIVGQARPVSDSVSRAGGLYRDAGGMRLLVRIVIERFSDDSLVKRLRNMSSHLERGGWVGFARDTAVAWGAFVDTSATPVLRGVTGLSTPAGNAWAAWAAVNPPVGSDVAVHSAHPESIYQEHPLSGMGLGGAQVTLGAGSTYTLSQPPVLVRHVDFFPALKLPEQMVGNLAQSPIVISHRRLNHTLDMTLIEDWSVIAAAAAGGGAAMAGIAESSEIKHIGTASGSLNGPVDNRQVQIR